MRFAQTELPPHCRTQRACSMLDARCTRRFERSRLGFETKPPGQGGRAAFLKGLAAYELAFEIEMLVDGGVNRRDF